MVRYAIAETHSQIHAFPEARRNSSIIAEKAPNGRLSTQISQNGLTPSGDRKPYSFTSPVGGGGAGGMIQLPPTYGHHSPKTSFPVGSGGTSSEVIVIL